MRPDFQETLSPPFFTPVCYILIKLQGHYTSIQCFKRPQSAGWIFSSSTLVPPAAEHSKSRKLAADGRKFLNKLLVTLRKADGKPYLPATYHRMKHWEDFSTFFDIIVS